MAIAREREPAAAGWVAPIERMPSPAGGQVVLEVDAIEKRYGDVVAVDGVSLAVRRGEVFGFLGPNGAGKTTTIGMILGLLAPTAGEVRLFGSPLAGNERALLPRIGALVETPTFYPFMSARDNLRAVALTTSGVNQARVEEILRLIRLDHAADRPFRTYSLGMKQRLGIGAALLADPEIVILDEPTNGLDPAGIVEIRALLRDLAREGRAVFLSSHQLNEVQQICDRVAIVYGGRVVTEGTVSDLLVDQREIRLTVSDPVKAAATLRSLPWVRDVRSEHGALTVRGIAPHPFAVGEALGQAGVWVGQLTRHDGTLEHLFLQVTNGLAGTSASGMGGKTHVR